MALINMWSQQEQAPILACNFPNYGNYQNFDIEDNDNPNDNHRPRNNNNNNYLYPCIRLNAFIKTHRSLFIFILIISSILLILFIIIILW